MRAVVLSLLIAGGATGSAAESAAARSDLARRMSAEQTAIWPDGQFSVAFDGCALTFRRVFPGRFEDTTNIWLADIDTRPEAVFREGQLMGDDSGRTWTDFNVVWRWRQTVLAQHHDAMADWTRAVDAAYDLAPDAEGTGWFGRLFGATAKVDRHAQAQAQAQAFSELRLRAEAGAFGPFVQRNQAWRSGMDEKGQFLDPFLEFGDPASSEWASPLGMTLKGATVTGILDGLHAHAEEACGGQD